MTGLQWGVAAAAAPPGPPVRFSGVLLGIGVVVVLAGLGVVRRALRARERIVEKYAERRAATRDEVVASRLRPQIAEIATEVHPLVEWPRRGHGDIRPDVEGLLEQQRFAAGLALIARSAGDADEFRRCQERMVGAAQRQGATMGVFLPAWIYLVFWASETGEALPKALTAAVALVAAGAVGWFLAEALSEVRDADAFARLETVYSEPEVLG